ncbi:MAG: ABC transporter ATP-binding protein [Kiloniellales bacterium]
MAGEATTRLRTGGTAPGNESLPPAIELRGIDKSFGPVRANRDVSLVVESGTIHGIVGENGAGKSTLMSILYGFYQADGGEIYVAGQPVTIRNPQDAIGAGIGMVHQHFKLVDSFTVLENVVLGAESGAMLAPSLDKARGNLIELEQDYGLRVDPDALVEDLPVGDRQRVEILKALYRGAQILILDEPTGVLTPQETDQLFRILSALRERDTTILLITHKLREIMEITDAVSVMRGGEMIAHRKTAETTKEELADLMVGRQVRLDVEKSPRSPGASRLEVENITVRDSAKVARVDGVSFTLRAGEIVGIAGVSGNGQSELLEALAGIRPIDEGRFVITGREVTPRKPTDPAELRALKVAHVPEDRQRLGLVGTFSASESAILGYQDDPAYNGTCLMREGAITGRCRQMMEAFDVRPRTPDLRSENLSGGNQQKLIVAREMDRAPEVLLVGQPTRGVDIGAIEFIRRQLLARRDAGCAVLLVSVELDEVMALSDRILVMFEGRIVGEVPAEQADERTLGLMMANAFEAEAVTASPGATP